MSLKEALINNHKTVFTDYLAKVFKEHLEEDIDMRWLKFI